MYIIIVVFILFILWSLKQNGVFCRHKWESLGGFTLPDDKGRLNATRHIANYQCCQCGQYSIRVSHLVH